MPDTLTRHARQCEADDQILFHSQAANPALRICVILPVRDEEDNILKALEALRLQTDADGNLFAYSNYEVLMLANNCTDQSVSIARNYQIRFPDFNLHIENIILPAATAHIGTVRRMLMDAAYDRFSMINRPDGVIASTDSDSQVHASWLYQTLSEIEKGNDVVGGRILTKPEKTISRLYYLRDITYKHLVSRLEDLIDPQSNDRWPRHFQCFGASFAVTCRIYDLSGRLPVVPFLEDMAFHKSLTMVDAKIRLSPLVRVNTSSRIQGRVDFGLSIQLKQWGEMNLANHAIMVEPAGSVIARFTAKKLLRRIWAQAESENSLATVADLLHLSEDWLQSQLGEHIYFGTFWDVVENQLQMQGWLQIWPKQDICNVIPALKSEIYRIRLPLSD